MGHARAGGTRHDLHARVLSALDTNDDSEDNAYESDGEHEQVPAKRLRRASGWQRGFELQNKNK